MIYTLWQTDVTMENHHLVEVNEKLKKLTIFHGKLTMNGFVFKSEVLNYQRVNIKISMSWLLF